MLLPTPSLPLLLVLVAAVGHAAYDSRRETATRALTGDLRLRRTTAQSSPHFTGPIRRTSKRRGNIGFSSVPMRTRLTAKEVPKTARFKVSLKDYENDGLVMSGNYTCDCLRNRTACPFLETVQNTCLFGYTAIVYTPNEIGLFSTFFKKPANKTENQEFGSLPFAELSDGIDVFTKPTQVVFLVHNLGLVVNEPLVVYIDYLWLVDSFQLSLADVRPSMRSNETTLLGNATVTKLIVEYSLNCIDGFVGSDCELSCTDFQGTAAAGGDDASKKWLCRSVLTERYSLCVAPIPDLVNSLECRECQLSRNGSECVVLEQIDAHVDAQLALLVSPMWRWLSLALLIFLVLFVVFALLVWLFCRCESREVADRDQLILGSGGAVSPHSKEYAVGSPLSGGGWTKPAVPPAAVTHGVYRAQPAWADSPSVSSHGSHFNTDYRYPSSGGQLDSSMRREAQV